MSGKKAKLLRRAMLAPTAADRTAADAALRNVTDGGDAGALADARVKVITRTRAYRSMKEQYANLSASDKAAVSVRMHAQTKS